MTTVVLKGGKHKHEHFRFEEKPTRIFVQTSSGGSGMYGRPAKAAVYQDTGMIEDGCRVFAYVRTKRELIDGFIDYD